MKWLEDGTININWLTTTETPELDFSEVSEKRNSIFCFATECYFKPVDFCLTVKKIYKYIFPFHIDQGASWANFQEGHAREVVFHSNRKYW